MPAGIQRSWKALRPRQIALVSAVAAMAGYAGSAAHIAVWAFPRLVRMVSQAQRESLALVADHANNSAPARRLFKVAVMIA